VELDARVARSFSRKAGEINLLLDDRFDIIWHSDTVASILGWTDAVGRNAVDFVHPDDVSLVLETMARALSAQEHASLDPGFAPESANVRIRNSGNEWQTFETVTWNHLQDSDICGVLVTARRVPDRRDFAVAIEQLGTGEPISVVLPTIVRLIEQSVGGGASRAAIAWLDEGGVQYATAADGIALPRLLCEIAELGWTTPASSGRVLVPFVDAELDHLREQARRHGFRAAFVAPIEAPTGNGAIGAVVAWGTSSVDFHIAEQAPLHLAMRLAALAIAEHHTKRELRWAATHDPLTGLLNRAEFERRLDRAADSDLVLLYVDLDSFKPINDTHGHPVGDIVLRSVARRIEQVVGDCGVVGRMGGDEFAVMCLGTNDPTFGQAVADRIVTAVREPMVLAGAVIAVGASVGVAVGAQPLIPAILTAEADRALYRAKHIGKNTVCVA
jgi:diguanylate cyclase (GGDEF)-like protein